MSTCEKREEDEQGGPLISSSTEKSRDTIADRFRALTPRDLTEDELRRIPSKVLKGIEALIDRLDREVQAEKYQKADRTLDEYCDLWKRVKRVYLKTKDI